MHQLQAAFSNVEPLGARVLQRAYAFHTYFNDMR